jgi:hypothetical protein
VGRKSAARLGPERETVAIEEEDGGEEGGVVVGELEQLAFGLKVLVQEVDLGPGGQPLQLVLQDAEVHGQGLGVHRRLARDPGAEEPLCLAHLVEIGEKRPEQGDHSEQREPDQHRAAQALFGLAPDHRGAGVRSRRLSLLGHRSTSPRRKRPAAIRAG